MDLHITDPEFAERFEHFAFEEVINEENQQLEPSTRYLAILATLIGCGGADQVRLCQKYLFQPHFQYSNPA